MMLTEFLVDIEVLTADAVYTTDEEGVTTLVSPATYRTQTVLANRPETKTKADLDRIVGLGKSAKVRTQFIKLVNNGIAWDWLDAHILHLNDVDTYEKFVPEDVLDEDDVIIGQTSMPTPVAPIRLPNVVVEYKNLRKSEYPSLADFADAFIHNTNGDTGPLKAYVDKCNAVKEKYPK